MNTIRIKRTSGWERDYGKYIIYDDRTMTVQSTNTLFDAIKLYMNKIKFYKSIEKCCR